MPKNSNLARLLERYVERELAALHGRAASLPVIRYRWGKNELGHLVPLNEGACYANGTRPREHDIVDEFGYVFRELCDEDQEIVVTEYFLGEKEWRDLAVKRRLSVHDLRARLRLAWTQILSGWHARMIGYS